MYILVTETKAEKIEPVGIIRILNYGTHCSGERRLNLYILQNPGLDISQLQWDADEKKPDIVKLICGNSGVWI
jgi:hypothetical protein